MSDEETSKDAGEHNITVEQAYRLKNDINKSITYGLGLNAREVIALKTLSSEQWTKARRNYDKWVNKMQVFNSVVLLVIAAACLYARIHFVKMKNWVGWAGWPLEWRRYALSVHCSNVKVTAKAT